MKNNIKYGAYYMPNSEIYKEGFDSQQEAWEYIYSRMCETCKELYIKGEPTYCDAEWTIEEIEK